MPDGKPSGKIEYSAVVLIVGAGMTGLAAAAELRKAGFEPLVIDKGRGVGGRMASRRIGGAVFDHGAQFITTRDGRFEAAMREWSRQGVAREWFSRPDGGGEPHIRWRGEPGMTAIPKAMAGGVDLVPGRRIEAVREHPAGWMAEFEDGGLAVAGAVLLTPPAPQTMAILESGGVEIAAETWTMLKEIEFDRCLAVMAALDGPSNIPPPGGMKLDKGPVEWLADNFIKGVSPIPAVTLHANAEYSLAHWDRDRESTALELFESAKPWIGARVETFQIHGWKFSKPRNPLSGPFLTLRENPPLIAAGDAFGGPRVEGAALSGWAAAEAIQRMVIRRID